MAPASCSCSGAQPAAVSAQAPALSNQARPFPMAGSCGAGVEVWVPDEKCGCWSQWRCSEVCPAIWHVPAMCEEGIAQSCLQQAWGWPAPYSSRCDFFKSVFLSLLLTFNAQAKACLALWQKPCLSVTPHVQISGDLCCIPIGD